MDLQELLFVKPGQFAGVELSQEEALRWFALCGAVWLHDGKPKSPHAELTSGMCSNGYFNCPEILKFPNLAEIFACQLARRLQQARIGNIDWVISSAYAAITLGHEVAKRFGVAFGHTEKDPTDPDQKRMLWRRMQIPAGANVLQIEELGTTLGTTLEVRRAVKEGNTEPVNFLPTVGMLVHRPPKLPIDYGDIRIVSLIEKAIWAVPPAECPLCKAGSPRYRPKTHWPELTGKGLIK